MKSYTLRMENQRVVLIFALVFPILHGAQSSTFTFQNSCPFTVWPGTLTGSGAPLSSTGFELATGASNSLSVTGPWSGRMWARTGCTNTDGKFMCATGDCASGQVTCNGAGANRPVSLAEFFIAADNGKDFYDVSLVDGFNLPLSITPQGGAWNCSSTSCPAIINQVCPPELQVVVDGAVVGCKSACVAFNQPQFCCTGAFDSPQTCPPTTYSLIFKSRPQAHSYAFDDKTSTFTCTGGANYLITFCP